MARNKLLLTALAVALLLPLWATTGAAEAQGPRIDRLEIMALDLNRRERVGTVLPGQTFDMDAGETLRFRMVAVPNGSGERYPATRFWVVSGKSRIKQEAANVEVGNITLTALNNNRSRERTEVRYEIVDRGHNIPPGLRTGSFFINVNGNGNGYGRPSNQPGYGNGGYDNRGAVVTLYEHQEFQGRSTPFNEMSVANVNDYGFPADMASSVRLAQGCRVTLFEHPNFRGRSATIVQDERDLRYTQVGSDTVSSFQVDCNGNGNVNRDQRGSYGGVSRRGRAARQGGTAANGQTTNSSVTLYEHQNYRGAQETFWSGRLADIKNSGVGVNRASSVRINGDCQVTLYEDTNFEGRVSVITRDVPDLSRERVGNDTVSSIIVDCR